MFGSWIGTCEYRFVYFVACVDVLLVCVICCWFCWFVCLVCCVWLLLFLFANVWVFSFRLVRVAVCLTGVWIWLLLLFGFCYVTEFVGLNEVVCCFEFGFVIVCCFGLCLSLDVGLIAIRIESFI